MVEIWKDIKGFEGLYQVSNTGIVRGVDRLVNTVNSSKRTVHGKTIKQTLNKYGYWVVGLSNQGKHKLTTVHRLVASAFIPNPDKLETVNHINEIKTDNMVLNLEWMSAKDNTNYGTGTQRQVEKRSKQVIQLKDSVICNTFKSMSEASRVTGVLVKDISHCCNNKRITAKGYEWKFKEGC